MNYRHRTPLTLALSAALAAGLLAGCGGGSSDVVQPVVAKVTNAPGSAALGKSFVVSGSAVSQPKPMKTLAWTVTTLTTGAPDLTVANADCAESEKSTSTVNVTSQSTWACDAIVSTPASLLADASYRVTLTGADEAGNAGTASHDITLYASGAGGSGPVAGAPVATTASAVSAVGGSDVGLNCLASGGAIASGSAYRIQWVTKSNPAGLQIASTSPTPDVLNFKAPAVTAAATVTFQCRVSDDNLATATADSVVTITPAPASSPVANAGGWQAVTQGALVELNGATSSSPGGLPLYYTWTQVSGPLVTLAGANSARASFVAPVVSASTALTFRLVAQQTPGTAANATASETDLATVYVQPDGPLQLTMPLSSVVRSGTAVSLAVTVAPSVSPLFFEWTQVSGPSVTMGAANTATTSFIAPTVTATPVDLVFSVKVSRKPIAESTPGDIHTSDVTLRVTP